MMNTTRLEAFSDAVIAVIITIMVLDLKAPHGTTLASIKPLIPVFTSYVLSFIFIAIYWNNHHHLLHAIQKVNGKILWANLHLLFWLSLVPFLTSWIGENRFATWPVALYGMDLLAAAIAYHILTHLLIAYNGGDSPLAAVHQRGLKDKEVISIILYLTAIPLAFFSPLLAYAIYVLVAAMWLVPDRRIENML